MTRRSITNERYTAENAVEGRSKKSASKAKPARKAASSLRDAAPEKKSRRELRREQKEKEQKRLQREQARYGTVSSQESIDITNLKKKQIRSWRNLWWICIGVAVACIVGAYFLQNVNGAWFIVVISLSYVLLGSALAIEFGKIRKLRNTTYVVTKKSKKAIKHEIEDFNLKKDDKASVLKSFRQKAGARSTKNAGADGTTDLPFDE